jgi:MFS family permease
MESPGASGAGRRVPWLTRALERAPMAVMVAYAVVMAFSVYFCMYAFRKPFAAASWHGQMLGPISLKGALVIGQLVGYASSKVIGIKFNSELPLRSRRNALFLLILASEAALFLFAVVPPPVQVVALFLNGLPLGTVWGIVFSFLEGRTSSEILGAGLSCSYVVASGYVKTVGGKLLHAGVSEDWMPAMTGLVFLVPFFLFAWGLSFVPAPSSVDVAQRTEREPMEREARRRFTRTYWPGLLLLVIVYLFLTAYRDFRDNYAADILHDMGLNDPTIFTRTEVPIAVAVLLVLALLFLVKDNRRGLLGAYVIMIGGAVLIGVATLLFDNHAIGGQTWLTLVGLGLFLGYVPYGCVLFDRTIAALGTVATAVFLIYVSDGVAYGGSVLVNLYKALGQADLPYLDFFRAFSYATAVVTAVCFTISGVYFLRRARTPAAEPAALPDSAAPR